MRFLFLLPLILFIILSLLTCSHSKLAALKELCEMKNGISVCPDEVMGIESSSNKD